MNSLLVVAGNLIVDDVVFEDGTTRIGQAGGAALYAALGAALWRVPVGIASIVGDDYPQEILASVGARGIDLAGVRQVAGPSLRIWLLYEGRRRQVIHHLDSPSHAQMSPQIGDLPATWSPDAIHLAPMPLATQLAWLESLEALESPEPDGRNRRSDQGRQGVHDRDAPRVFRSLDLFDLVDERSLESLQPAFRKTDLLLLSEDELLLEDALESPEICLRQLVPGYDATTKCPGTILLKRGDRGGLAYDREQDRMDAWRPRASALVEPTGAGDAFAGGLLAGLLCGRELTRALEQGIVSASFALQGQGADGILAATPADCAARFQEWFG